MILFNLTREQFIFIEVSMGRLTTIHTSIDVCIYEIRKIFELNLKGKTLTIQSLKTHIQTDMHTYVHILGPGP